MRIAGGEGSNEQWKALIDCWSSALQREKQQQSVSVYCLELVVHLLTRLLALLVDGAWPRAQSMLWHHKQGNKTLI